MYPDEKSFYEALGARIRAARKAKKLSQEDLAELLNVHQRAISDIEYGKRRIMVRELVIIAEAVDLPIMHFVEAVIDQNDEDTEVLTQFRRLQSPELRQIAINILRVLSGNSSF